WIPASLPLAVQASLRSLMGARVSDKDTEGYLYLHELVAHSPSPAPPPASAAASDGAALIKLGRALRPVQRLSQWRASCPSHRIVVRDVLPRSPASSSSSSSSAPTRVGGTVQGVDLRLVLADRGTPNHHRWERLCLVELSGRALPSPSPALPDAREACADCGARHVERFWVPRGAVTGEWDAEGAEQWDVREVMQRWERWCRDVLG
ncbi:hypothetical protein JCM10207_005546, partial [Rhodosporidiobolus poonsookiae]